MVQVSLIGSVRLNGRVGPSTQPDAEWQQNCESWPLPGRFSFFVFQVIADYDLSDAFPGLDWYDTGGTYFVAGTICSWDAACFALLNTKSSHDVCQVYRYVYSILAGAGHPMRGQRTAQTDFYLI